MDSHTPWMELRKERIHAARRQSMDCFTRIAPAQAQFRAHVRTWHGIVRDIELCDQLASHSDTLQKRRPWLTEKRSRTIYIRDTLRTVLVHRILPVSCPYK